MIDTDPLPKNPALERWVAEIERWADRALTVAHVSDLFVEL